MHKPCFFILIPSDQPNFKNISSIITRAVNVHKIHIISTVNVCMSMMYSVGLSNEVSR